MNKSYILVLTIIGLIVVSILSLEISPTAWATAKKEKNLHVPVNVFANTNVEAWTEDGKIVARLTMDNGSPISNEELRFHLGDKIVKAKTDEDGIASAVFTDYAGQVTIEFSGDKEKYLNPSKTEIEVSSETLLLKNILPPEARNIVVKENGKIVNHFSNVKYADLTINLKRKSRGFSATGFATGKSSVKNGMGTEIKKRQHKVILFQPVKWSLEVGDYTIEYETPEPTAKEIYENGKKIIIVKSNATDHYYNVSAFTTLPELDYKPRLYRIVSGKRIDVTDNPVYNVSYWDTNGNGLYDKITWIVPMLSNDTYEVDLTILNVHSYPPIGGNWTVQFTTQGTADLWIRPVNGTTWSLTGKDTDLQFLDIRCGNTSVSYQWINDSVYVPNWSCNETGYEISHVITSGHHYLEFRFDDVVKYAENFASGQTICGVAFGNITYEFLNPYGDTVLAVDENGNVLIMSSNVHNVTKPPGAPANGFGISVSGEWKWTFNSSDAYISGNILEHEALSTSIGPNDVLIVNASNGVPLLYFNGSSGDIVARSYIVYNGSKAGCEIEITCGTGTYANWNGTREYLCDILTGQCDLFEFYPDTNCDNLDGIKCGECNSTTYGTELCYYDYYCNPSVGNCEISSVTFADNDNDNDGYTPNCGYSDCCDSDPETYPGFSQYCSSQNNCSSWDRNCDGTISKSWIDVNGCGNGLGTSITIHYCDESCTLQSSTYYVSQYNCSDLVIDASKCRFEPGPEGEAGSCIPTIGTVYYVGCR